MHKFCVYLIGALFSVVGITPALSGPVYDALKRILEEQGLQNVTATSVKEGESSLSVTKLVADQDGYKIQINELTAINPKVNNWGLEADQLIISGASRTGDGIVIGFGKTNVDRVELPYPSVKRGIGWSKAIMSDAIIIDDAMNAFSFDRLILSRRDNGKIYELGYQGHISGQVLSVLFPWTLNPVSKDRVKFSGNVSLDVKSEGLSMFDGLLNLEGYGRYNIKIGASGLPQKAFIRPSVFGLDVSNVEISNVEIVLDDMKWLGMALNAHSAETRKEYIEFVSKLFGGIIAGLGTIDDGILLKSSIEHFMNDPYKLVIKASPGVKIKDLKGNHERRSLNLNIVESLSANE